MSKEYTAYPSNETRALFILDPQGTNNSEEAQRVHTSGREVEMRNPAVRVSADPVIPGAGALLVLH